jgi:plastocyanin
MAELAHEALIVHVARLPAQEYARLAMIPTGVASALSVLAAAPSKVPFYVAGGALAAWAVALAVFGIRRPGFPSSRAGRRGVIGASLLLVLATASMAVATAGEEHEGEGEAAATSTRLTLTADPSGAIAYDRTEAAVKAGTVTVTLVNESSIGHNVAIASGERELGRSDTITGDETELRVELEPGEYEFYCTVTGHREAGMEGTLTVR